MSSSDVDYINHLTNITIILHQYILPVFYLASNIGNILSILIFLKKTWRKNVCVFYFQICLLSNSCYNNCTILSVIFINGFQINVLNSSVALCKVYFYTIYLFVMISPTVLVLAAIDRLLISSEDVDTRLYSSKRLAYFSISIITCVWIVFNTHFVVKATIIQLYPSYFICYLDVFQPYRNFVAYSLSVINAAVCLLMIVLCVFAFTNVRHIRTIPREIRHQRRSMNKKDFQLLRCLFVQCSVYILFSVPVCTYYVYDGVTKSEKQSPLEQARSIFLYNFLILFITFIIRRGFFVFVIVSKAFRHELQRMMYKIIGKNLVSMREEGHVERDNVELNVVSGNVVPT